MTFFSPLSLFTKERVLACIENVEIALAIESPDYDLISLQIHPNTFPDRVIRYNKLEFYYM